MNTTLASCREQIQEDLISLLDSQFGLVEYVDEVKDLACQIVVDNFKKLETIK
jgi:hypothetical protein